MFFIKKELSVALNSLKKKIHREMSGLTSVM